jgi:hypothetical protein
LPDAFETFDGALVSGALPEAFGGLLSLQMALTFLVPPLEPELPDALLLLLPLPPPPQAVSARAAAVPIAAAADRVDLRMVAPFLLSRRGAPAA